VLLDLDLALARRRYLDILICEDFGTAVLVNAYRRNHVSPLELTAFANEIGADHRRRAPERKRAAFPGRSAACSEAERCAAGPGSRQIPSFDGPGSAAHHFGTLVLRRVRGTMRYRAPETRKFAPLM
jgi:hypothetical protein